MNMESDHTPAAFTPPTTEGVDNLTQPSSGEQPTSVEDKIDQLLGFNSTALEAYYGSGLKDPLNRAELAKSYGIDPMVAKEPDYAWERYKVKRKELANFIAEERRQAKIEILEELLDTRRPQVIGWEATIESCLTEFKELRGENNE